LGLDIDYTDDGDDSDEQEVEIIAEIVAIKGPRRRWVGKYRDCSDHFSVKRDMVRHSRTHDDQYAHSISYMCHYGLFEKISNLRYSGLTHLQRHYRRRNWDNFPVDGKEDMINTTDPGLIVVRFDGRRILFDSVLLSN
jgi:hypothetical protein